VSVSSDQTHGTTFMLALPVGVSFDEPGEL
jgi:hypothetical protein